MAQKRIYQIAKELNISHIEIIKFLENNNIEVKNHMMPVDEGVYNTLMLEFSKEKKQVERKLREKARQAIVDIKENIEEIPAVPAPAEIELPKNSDKLLNKESEPTQDKAVPKEDRKKEKNESKSETKTDLHLKKININEIADKIHKTNKLNTANKKLNIHSSLSSLKKKSKKRSKKRNVDIDVESTESTQTIKVPEFTSVDELSKLMKVNAQDVIVKCIGMGMMVTINQRLDMDTIIMVADEFGFDVETLDIYNELLAENMNTMIYDDLIKSEEYLSIEDFEKLEGPHLVALMYPVKEDLMSKINNIVSNTNSFLYTPWQL